MYALVYNEHGQEQWRLRLTDDAPLDCDYYANIFAGLYGFGFEGSEPGADIPDGMEDFRVVLQETPYSVICWTSKNYTVEAE